MSAEQIQARGEEFLLIDLSSIAYPVWHVSRSEPNPNATSIKTVDRVRSMAAAHPHAAICADSGKSFRAELDPTYKANRPVSDATLQHQIMLAIETLRADGFPVWAVKGYEADDLIATAVARALERDGASVVVASADKDLLALVGPRVRAISTRDGADYDEAAVLAKFGVKPCQMRDYLTLVGDSSDNIQGAKGIGAKKAAELLKTFPDVDFLYLCIDDKTAQFQPSTLRALEELRPRLATVRALVSMRTDAPIPFDEILAERVPVQTPMSIATEEEMQDQFIETEAIRFVDETTPAAPEPEAERSKPTEAKTGTALMVAPSPAEWERQLEPRSMREVQILAENLHASKLFSAFGSPQAVLAVVLAGRELGIQALASMRAFHVIENTPSLSAELIRALVIKSGKAKFFKCIRRSAEAATFRTHRIGDEEPDELTYTLEEGRLAWPKKSKDWLDAFLASGWGRNPADMCVARASMKLARLVYPDVTLGLLAYEEVDRENA